jgi:hypothetical protein
MSKFTVYDTICKADIDALLDAGASIEIGFDASHPGDVKPVHLDLTIGIDPDQIGNLRRKRYETATKFRLGVLFNGGVQKFECYHFEDDIVRASTKEVTMRQERATVRHGGVGGFVQQIDPWK